MTLSWWPVVLCDILGALAALGLATACFVICRDWSRRQPENVFRQYILLLTTALALFAVSRSVGHLVKQLLVLNGLTAIWRYLSPFSGAINTAVFVVVFAFGIYFQQFRRIYHKMSQYQNHLEKMVEERTAKLEEANARLEDEIIERRRIEETLRETNTTLENVFNSSNPICITDLDFQIMDANRAYREIWPSLTNGHELCYENRPGAACQTERCPLIQIKEGRQEVICEMQKISPEGVARHFIVTARPFLDADGRLAGIVETFQDITRRKEAETQLAAERERLAVTLASIGDGVIATDTKGEVTLINPTAELLTGWPAEEAIGRPLTDVFHIVHELSGEPVANPVDQVLRTGQTAELANHTILITRTGRRRQIADSGAPIRGPEANIIGVVLVFRDVTEKLRIEREMQKMEKLESIGLLAGGIAHDYNNLLAAILGNLELAGRQGASEDKLHALLENARMATLRARELTNQLLTFAKGGAPVKKTASLGDIVRDSAEFVLHGGNVGLHLDIPADLWLVEVDSGQISQVIQNLVLNARDAMPDGGTITIRCANLPSPADASLPTPKPGPYVRVTIQDTGCGIPADVLDRIFEPYFTTKESGNGLGLAIVHSIITRHEGMITVESVEGKGTAFHLYLPAVPGQEQPRQSQAALPSAPTGRRILLMDDEPLVRKVSAAMLTELGHTVVTAQDGGEAVQLFEQHQAAGTPFDLVIMDLTVPGGMGGKQAAQEILARAPKAKLVVASGYSNDPVLAEPEKYGFMAALVKPYLLADLEAVLARI